MARIAKKIRLTEKQRNTLTQIVMSRTYRPDQIERAKIILLSSGLKQDKQISEELGVNQLTVRKWRKRWLKNEEKLLLIDAREKGINYIRKIQEIISEEQRSGAPSIFTAEQICQIMSLACEPPEDSGLPLSHWSVTSLVDEIIKRGIVDTIASWLNQVEIWFGILVNRLLKRLSVKSTDELKNKILSFVTYFNETMAKAFKWTYKGRVLKA